MELTHALWRELHEQQSPTKEWLAEWTARVPNTSCGCAKSWAKVLGQIPPDFSSPEAFFIWSWRVHNVVNVKLGRPIFPYAKAVEAYGK